MPLKRKRLNTYDRMSVHPVTLSFKTRQLQQEFLTYQTRRSLKLTRWVLLTGTLLYLAYMILDRKIVPEAAGFIFNIRVFVASTLLLVFAGTYSRHIQKLYQPVMSVVVLITGSGILLMIMISGPAGSMYYYAGLILTIMFAHGLLSLRFIYASLATWIIVVFYEFHILTSEITPFVISMNNSFFLISANILGMFTSYSLEYYMRHVFWQKRILEQKSEQLAKEHARKSQELDQARRIQLAMLPQTIPVHPEAELAVSMTTATEIGGDYYDFCIDDGGALTFAIGDAAGHGAQAGAMVTATKFLFANYAGHQDIDEFLNYATHSLKQMSLPRLFIALAIGRIDNYTLEIAGAGLPPLLLVRESTDTVEEIPLKGIPLGGYGSGLYQKLKIPLNQGDALLLMTDGFPELMNHEKEELSYERIKQEFGRTASQTPDNIIKNMTDLAENWLDGNSPKDDITLMAIKMRNHTERNI